MIAQFKQFLGTKGITPTSEIEEKIEFNLDGLYYLFVYEKSDPYYFRIILPNIFKIERENHEYDSLVNNLNQRYKVAKVTINNDNMVWVATEQFVYSRENIESLFERCFAVLKAVIEYFREQQSRLSHD